MALTITDLHKQADRCLHWVRWADADYLSARVLLRSGLVLQGTASANTAIEKYLKAALHYWNINVPNSHSVLTLYREVRKHDTTALHLNENFLEFLQKAYALRYPDKLPEGFNIAFNHAKILVELDCTVYEIAQRFHITKGDTTIAMVFTEGEFTKNRLIIARNAAAKQSERGRMFRNKSYSYDIRVSGGKLHQMPYATVKIKDDGDFIRRAFEIDKKAGVAMLAYSKYPVKVEDGAYPEEP